MNVGIQKTLLITIHASVETGLDSMTLDTFDQFTQVPEPSTYAIAGLGFALLMLRRVRRR